MIAKSPSRIVVAQQSLIKNAAFVAPIQAEQTQEIKLLPFPPAGWTLDEMQKKKMDTGTEMWLLIQFQLYNCITWVKNYQGIYFKQF